MIVLSWRGGQHTVACPTLDQGLNTVADTLSAEAPEDSSIILDVHCHGPLPNCLKELPASLTRRLGDGRRIQAQHVRADSAFAPETMITIQATIGHQDSGGVHYTYLSWTLIPCPDGVTESVHETAQILLHDSQVRGEQLSRAEAYQTAERLCSLTPSR